VTLTWTAGSTATGYQFRRKLSTASNWGTVIQLGNVTKFTIDSLFNGSGYDFQVRSSRTIAVDPWLVCSAWSATVSATPVPPIPEITGASLTSTPVHDTDGDDAPDTYGRRETIEVTVTWDRNVTWDVTSGAVRVQLAIGTGTKHATLVTGGMTTGSARSLRFRYTVEAGVADSDGIFVKVVSGQTVFAVNGATLQDAFGQTADLNHPVSQSPNAGHKVDGSLVDDTAPTLSSARVIGATLTLTFDEILKAVVPDPGAFTVSGATGNPTVTAVAVDGSTVTLTLSAAVGDSDTGITVSYAAANSGSKPLQDRVANQVADFSGHGVHTVPLAPALRQPTVGGTTTAATVTLTWEPDSDGGSAITEWQYRQSIDGTLDDESWTAIAASDAATTTYAVTGLTYGTAYRFAVRAVNAVGAGHSSNEVDVTPALPAAPTLTAIPGNREVALTWDRYDAGFTIAGWQYRQRTLDDADWNPDWTAIPGSNAATATHTVTGLANGTTYLFQVRGCAPAGQDEPLHCHVESVAASTTPSANAPSFGGAAIGALTLSEGTPVEPIILPAAHGGNGALTYALTSVPAGLAGLEFDATSRTLSGTPTHAGSFTVTYLAEDADANRSAADTAALRFRMTVNENTITQRRATLETTLAAVGRRALASSAANIGTRFPPRDQSDSSLVLAGHPVAPAGPARVPDLSVHRHDAPHRSPRHVSADELLAGSVFEWVVDTSAKNDDAGYGAGGAALVDMGPGRVARLRGPTGAGGELRGGGASRLSRHRRSVRCMARRHCGVARLERHHLPFRSRSRPSGDDGDVTASVWRVALRSRHRGVDDSGRRVGRRRARSPVERRERRQRARKPHAADGRGGRPPSAALGRRPRSGAAWRRRHRTRGDERRLGGRCRGRVARDRLAGPRRAGDVDSPGALGRVFADAVRRGRRPP